MMLQRGLIVELLFGCLLLSSASFVRGTVSLTILKWTFDTHDGMTVVPEDNAENNFKADLSPLGSDIDSILVPGIKNTSLYVNGKSFNLATGLGSTCIRDVDVCGSVWTFSFWLKLVNWHLNDNPVIFRTTNVDRTEPGIYVGEGSNDDILVYFRGSSGTALWRSFKQELVWNQWGYVTVVVGKKFITILVNSTVQSGITIRQTVESQPVTPAKLVVGAENGPTFYLDDLVFQFSDNLTTSTTFSTTGPVSTTAVTATSTIAETTTSVIGNETPQNLSNIWIPALIVLLLALVAAGCFLWFLCNRRRKKSRKGDLENHDGTALSDMNNGHASPSTIVPYHDEGSNVDTDDNYTDREDNKGPLLQN